MTLINVNVSSMVVPHMDEYTSGASNSFYVKFTFSPEWDDLTKLVSFKAGSTIVSQIMSGDTIAIPHEVLKPCTSLYIGVLGTQGETVVLPTIWKELRKVKYGVEEGTFPVDPTPSQYQQILDIAQSVRDDANAGRFDGEDGISVINIEIRDKHLYCLLSNGIEIDTGELPGSDGKIKIGHVANESDHYVCDVSFNDMLELYNDGYLIYFEYDGRMFFANSVNRYSIESEWSYAYSEESSIILLKETRIKYDRDGEITIDKGHRAIMAVAAIYGREGNYTCSCSYSLLSNYVYNSDIPAVFCYEGKAFPLNFIDDDLSFCSVLLDERVIDDKKTLVRTEIKMNDEDVITIETSYDTIRTAEEQDTIDSEQNAAIELINSKIPSSASNQNQLVTENRMSEAVSAVEAKHLYKTATQGSFATKAELLAATTFYNADGTLATPTKNDVTYILADESHSGKLAKYVISTTNPLVWGFVIATSNTSFTQEQLDALNSGITETKRTGYDSHVANSDIHVTAAQKTAWNNKQDAISDLGDIRAGAGKGNTALQPSALNPYRTAAEQNAIDLRKYEKPSSGIPASDIANGVIPTTLSQLSEDSTHRMVTDTEKSTWNAKGTYSKPADGIPKTDLASAVQESLGRADSALQSVPDAYRTAAAQDIIDASKQDVLTAGTGISIVNGVISCTFPNGDTEEY